MNTAEILIVEDNRHDVAMIREAFTEQNIKEKIRVVGNGVEALDYFFGPEGCLQKRDSDCPRFVLLDLKLPKVSGLEVLKLLKSDERTRNIPSSFLPHRMKRKTEASATCWGQTVILSSPRCGSFFAFCCRYQDLLVHDEPNVLPRWIGTKGWRSDHE